MRVASRCDNGFGLRRGFGAAFLQFGNKAFGLPDIQTVLDDALCGELLVLLIHQSENDFCVANRKTPFPDKFLNGFRQFQSRIAFATTARLLPTFAEISSCVS